jgi:hypothetical protein
MARPRLKALRPIEPPSAVRSISVAPAASICGPPHAWISIQSPYRPSSAMTGAAKASPLGSKAVKRITDFDWPPSVVTLRTPPWTHSGRPCGMRPCPRPLED